MHIVCKQVSELLGGIRLLKLFAWEQPAMKKVMQVGVGDQETCSLGIECVLITFIHMLCKQVMQVRDQEMAALRRFGILSALQVPLSLSLSLSLSLCVCVCVCVCGVCVCVCVCVCYAHKAYSMHIQHIVCTYSI
jgi:hypothetical protein